MTEDVLSRSPRTSGVAILQSMMRIRAFELRCEKLFRDGQVRGSMHLCTGQEAVPVGACSVLEPGDALSFTYRSHGWSLARGVSLEAAFGECLGRSTGTSGGRAGSKHLGNWSGLRALPANAIVAGGLPIANGVGLASKLIGNRDVALAVFGDGAVNEGGFHEALSQAAIWKLPVLFVCENNLYAEMTPGHEMNPVGDDLVRMMGPFDIPAVTCDGMDAEDVAGTVAEAADRARIGGGPTFIEAKTYRYCGHMTGDVEKYRTRDEIAQWRERDAIGAQAQRLIDRGELTTDQRQSIQAEVESEVESAATVALAAPEPSVEDLLRGAPSWTTGRR